MNIKNIKKQMFRSLMLALPLMGVGAGLTACTDWDDHYNGNDGSGSSMSLMQELQQHPELSDFVEVLQNTKVFRQHKKTATSYADLLNDGPTLTVFAPVNGSFDKQKLIELTKTASGDSIVEHTFVQNHLAYSPISVNGAQSTVRLMNSKKVEMDDSSIGNVEFSANNIRSKNGVMHVIGKEMPYRKTLYEAILADENLKSVGDFIRSYNEDYFNENASISSGIVDGQKVYADSVIELRNQLLTNYGGIGMLNNEDSTYIVLLPTENGWNTAWEQALTHYEYPKSYKAENIDSLQKVRTFKALMTDAVFTNSVQASPEDSLKSLSYAINVPEYHVYYKPYSDTGILSQATKTQECSNGTLYYFNEWPFDYKSTYMTKREYEAADEGMMTVVPQKKDDNNCTIKPATSQNPNVRNGRYMKILPTVSTSQWEVDYKITGTLSGKYDINIVLLPNSIDPDNTSAPKKLRFNASVIYKDADDEEQTFTEKNIYCDNVAIDTVKVATIDLPQCYNGLDNNYYIRLRISQKATAKQIADEDNPYQAEMYIDEIVLTAAKEEQ